ncbi:MAG TPA: FAD-binding protein [Egibacteraceae bacterium]|nr:FAD-binding protein [Egibacteraceae bacterium]
MVVVEKAARLGGTTAMSVGFFSAAGTTMQRRRGIGDSAEAFTADMAAANGDLERHENAELRELLIREAGRTLEDLRRLGLQFYGPTSEPPFSSARMHNIVPHSRAYIRASPARPGAWAWSSCSEPASRSSQSARAGASSEGDLLLPARGRPGGRQAQGHLADGLAVDAPTATQAHQPPLAPRAHEPVARCT